LEQAEAANSGGFMRRLETNLAPTNGAADDPKPASSSEAAASEASRRPGLLERITRIEKGSGLG